MFHRILVRVAAAVDALMGLRAEAVPAFPEPGFPRCAKRVKEPFRFPLNDDEPADVREAAWRGLVPPEVPAHDEAVAGASRLGITAPIADDVAFAVVAAGAVFRPIRNVGWHPA